MTDEANHLAAILARPGDDLMRRAYADWLEENAGHVVCGQCKGAGGRMTSDKHGYTDYWQACGTCNGSECVSNGHGERAEFIRVQCELARLEADEPTGDTRHEVDRKWDIRDQCIDALRRRERELLIREKVPVRLAEIGLAPSWSIGNGLESSPTGTNTRRAVFCRGFVESIACSWSDFRTHADAIRKATPLRKVRLSERPESMAGFFYDEFADGGRYVWTHADYPGLEFEMPQHGAYQRVLESNARVFQSQQWPATEPTP